MLRRVLVAVVIEVVVFAMLLFGGAGTVRWPAGWGFLFTFFICTGLLVVALNHYDPKLLKERMKAPWQAEQPRWDKVFLAVLSVFWCGWFVLMGMDAVRYGWTHLPAALQGIGAAGFVLGNWIIHLTFRENTFAAPVIKIQRERGQHVITTGPYAVVRHPMYVGAIVYFISIPLQLGSGWGLVGALLFLPVFALRILGEERELEQHLEGYREYKRRVRYRLIPRVW